MPPNATEPTAILKIAPPVQTMNRGFSSHDDEGEIHVDEKWLVSYADLMTLLFGLFVMLYVISMQTQGDPNRLLKNANADESLTQQAQANAPSEAQQVSASALVQMRSQYQNQIQELQLRLDQSSLKISELEKQNIEAMEQQKVAETKKQNNVEELKAEQDLPSLEQEQQKWQQERDRLSLENTKMATQLKSLQAKLQLLESQASARESQSLQINEMERKIASLEKEVSEASTLAASSSLMVLLKWPTDRHDLDMVLTDPKGRVFNFKKRQVKGSQGVFEVDSRFGPGVEMWQDQKPLAGKYKVEVVFYNASGNEKPARFQVQAVSAKTSVSSEEFTLDLTQQKQKTFTFELNNQGQVSDFKEVKIGEAQVHEN